MTPKIVEVEGEIVATGSHTIENAKLVYEYLDFETGGGRFKTGKVAVSHNIGKHVVVGESGVFVFTRYLGRALAMVIAKDNVEVNPIFRRFTLLHLLFPIVFFLLGLFFAPIWLLSIPIWAFGVYLLVLPTILSGKLKTIAKKHGVEWSSAKKGVNF
jgi:hypothetical protein